MNLTDLVVACLRHHMRRTTTAIALRTSICLAALGTTVAIFSGVSPASASTGDAVACPVAAHRGDHRVFTENGMGAFNQAVTDTSEWLEADARVTSDQQIMLMHDATVDRTTNGTGNVSTKTAAQMRQLRLNDGHYVPPYAWQVLELAEANNRKVLLELKTMGTSNSYSRLAAWINSAGVDRVTIQSSSTTLLQRIKTVLPRVKTAIVSKTALPVATVRANGGIVVEQSVATTEYLASLVGLPTFVFTVNSPSGWAKFSKQVDAIITDDPAGYIAARAALCAST